MLSYLVAAMLEASRAATIEATARELFADAPQNPPPAAAPAAPKWTGSITAGGIYTSGNSETRTANASADAEYKREKDRTTLGFLWIYSDEKNSSPNWTLTDRKTSARAKYDYFFTPKTYGLAQASADNDHQADLDLRTTVGIGAGHQFADGETWKFSGEAGLTDFTEDFGSSPDDDYIAARAAYNAVWKPNKMWEFGQTLEAFPSLENADDFYGHLDTRAKATLTESMFGQLQWIVDYDNTPAAGKERTDHRVLISVGWKF